MNSLIVPLLPHEEDDPFVIVDDDSDDDDSFVWTENNNPNEESDDEPFVVVAETLDSIMQKRNAENAHWKRSVFLVCTLILAYCMVLISLTTVVWATMTTTSTPQQPFMKMQQQEEELYVPSRHPPAVAMVGYPIIDLSEKRQAYHEVQVPDHAGYSQKQAPAPSVNPSISFQEDQGSAIIVLSPPKIKPVPFPSIAAPWKERIVVAPSVSQNDTAPSGSVTIHIPAPKARPRVVATPRRGSSRMLIPYAPTLHIPQWKSQYEEHNRGFNATTTLPQAPAPTPILLFPSPQEKQQAIDKNTLFVWPTSTTLLTQYTFADYFKQVDDGAVVVVAFYHPGLMRHDFLSTWQGFTDGITHTNILHAAVNCHAHPSVCREQGIAQFPTIRGFSGASQQAQDFDLDHPRASKKLLKFAKRLVSRRRGTSRINMPSMSLMVASSPSW